VAIDQDYVTERYDFFDLWTATILQPIYYEKHYTRYVKNIKKEIVRRKTEQTYATVGYSRLKSNGSNDNSMVMAWVKPKLHYFDFFADLLYNKLCSKSTTNRSNRVWA